MSNEKKEGRRWCELRPCAMDRVKQSHKLTNISQSPILRVPTKNLVYFPTSRNGPYGFLLVKTNLATTLDFKTKPGQFVQPICAK